MRIFSTKTKRHLLRGFTLVELVVIAGIISIVSAVLLTNNNLFGGNIILTNLAYDVALSVRQAQVYGVSTRATTLGSFTHAYGVHFKLTGGPSSSYIFFVDANNNRIYDNPPADTILQLIEVPPSYALTKICGDAGAGEVCGTTGTIDVSFLRPSPDALIQGNIESGASQTFMNARVELTNPSGRTKSVLISSTGQIS